MQQLPVTLWYLMYKNHNGIYIWLVFLIQFPPHQKPLTDSYVTVFHSYETDFNKVNIALKSGLLYVYFILHLSYSQNQPQIFHIKIAFWFQWISPKQNSGKNKSFFFGQKYYFHTSECEAFVSFQARNLNTMHSKMKGIFLPLFRHVNHSKTHHDKGIGKVACLSAFAAVQICCVVTVKLPSVKIFSVLLLFCSSGLPSWHFSRTDTAQASNTKSCTVTLPC